MADISFSCPYCGQVLEAPEDMAGQSVECPACQKEIAIPAPEAPATEEEVVEEVAGETEPQEAATGSAETAETEESEEPLEVEQEVEAPSAPVAGGSKCPECKAPMESGSVLCMRCGFHTKLGKKIKTSFG